MSNEDIVRFPPYGTINMMEATPDEINAFIARCKHLTDAPPDYCNDLNIAMILLHECGAELSPYHGKWDGKWRVEVVNSGLATLYFLGDNPALLIARAWLWKKGHDAQNLWPREVEEKRKQYERDTGLRL